MRVERYHHNLRARAIEYVAHWYHAREAAVVKGQHPLVTVQEMCLSDDEGNGAYRVSQKRHGRSIPPIRDMDPLARRLDSIMKHIGDVDRRWLRALELYAEHKTFSAAEKATNTSASRLYREFDRGLSVLQSEMVKQGL